MPKSGPFNRILGPLCVKAGLVARGLKFTGSERSATPFSMASYMRMVDDLVPLQRDPRPLAAATVAHRELLLPVEPEEPLVVGHVILPLEQNMQASVAETAALLGDRLHTLPKADIIHPGRLVSHRHAAAADGYTHPPFAHALGFHQMSDSFPLSRGRHHFFPSNGFMMRRNMPDSLFRAVHTDWTLKMSPPIGTSFQELLASPASYADMTPTAFLDESSGTTGRTSSPPSWEKPLGQIAFDPLDAAQHEGLRKTHGLLVVRKSAPV